MKLTKSKLKEMIREEIRALNEAVGKAELKKMIKMVKKAGAKKYDIVKSLASDLSKSEDEIVSSLEKYNLIGMVEAKIGDLNWGKNYKMAVDKMGLWLWGASNKYANWTKKEYNIAVKKGDKKMLEFLKDMANLDILAKIGVKKNDLPEFARYLVSKGLQEAKKINIDDLLKNPKVKEIMKRLGIKDKDTKSVVKIVQHFARNPSALKAIGV